MSQLLVKSGNDLAVGSDVVFQLKDMTILRGELREKCGAKRPDGLVGPMAPRQ